MKWHITHTSLGLLFCLTIRPFVFIQTNISVHDSGCGLTVKQDATQFNLLICLGLLQRKLHRAAPSGYLPITLDLVLHRENMLCFQQYFSMFGYIPIEDG